jgi:beta-galactosidase/beta-glucuronidase
MNFLKCYRLFVISTLGIMTGSAAETELLYLSGHGPKDAVRWDFSVTKGRRAGESASIPVPSNWEQHGFGSYNYGESPAGKADEHGIYKTRFTVPENWKGRRIRIVFDGVMTDASVKVNGKPAGPVHQGGFYRFRYDITKLLEPGRENTLEVDVSKCSADPQTERAERNADYWVFGGIFRPVFLEGVPERSIEQVSVNATADGVFKANVDFGNLRESASVEAQIYDAAGKPVGDVFSAEVPGGGASRVSVETRIPNPALWTAETPELYTVKFKLKKGDSNLHEVTQRFGFRTIEVRKSGGIFLNGERILLKGVCRHSFRPETGRALDKESCYDDVRLLKSMNMNAVRMSHYPPDPAFLEACDELGLYVINELSGWQNAHGTEIGRKLVREMVIRRGFPSLRSAGSDRAASLGSLQWCRHEALPVIWRSDKTSGGSQYRDADGDDPWPLRRRCGCGIGGLLECDRHLAIRWRRVHLGVGRRGHHADGSGKSH